MSFLESILWVVGITLLIFGAVEFKKDPDIISVFQKVFTLKYLLPLIFVIVGFVIIRFILILLSPFFHWLFNA
ncbi:hypothetical protein COS81_02675 [candidate division WWE3 bacterium CG06_land_8_20_14_3_00_42_16]|uniref:DUF1146 domain-containing protein n=4 Tax=Katanobacteria TaxID=422282 RepID=A0A2M7AN17_UNCKA|nr:MAG: hypothetical protein COS81_02675 [candidate division WWE3 bacterium CG06_land_8_20_14_3_00_42_16]PIZ43455.1 MAG: hypothetical protein COY34_00825 [candidate division WWE3 bacterium CG_4_10_14_0_2_um_filter_42_8]PJA37723.1 MAG: hypothetical protein CO181_02315 [candidate division WWE3 bacterium CG_4_9_14_3_um_filter_43_9]PJC68928.1 MAG: hypothetical protein CO015_02205 [candidate division WWE3 bacterium CG_4_8_14_3_um_filter_42_11]